MLLELLPGSSNSTSSPAPGSLSLTHPSFVSAVVNGKVHSALRPKCGRLHRCLFSDHPVRPLPPSVCLQGFPPISPLGFHRPMYTPTSQPLTSLVWRPAVPSKGLPPVCPSPVHSAALFPKLSYLPAVWGSLSIANLTLSLPFLKTHQGLPQRSG